MNAALRAAALAELEQKPEFKIIHTLVQQPDANPKAVAEEIIKRTLSEVDNEEGSHYYDTAWSVVEVARRTAPKHQEKLCDFVIALRQHSLKHPKTGEPLMDGGAKVWTELPAFGYTFADRLQHISGLSKKTSKEAQEGEKLEVFAAKLTGYPRDRRVDFAYHGQLLISDAFYLENAQIPPGCIVPTARLGCWWLIYAATTLWSKVQDPEDDDWSLGLWNIYKAGLRTTKATIRNYEVRILIDRAIAQMEMAEQGRDA
ncbi:hypothetical protein SLS60_010023 [Paraconiothyrium brasiliense]|uniref:Uncharacterized protein n=1 Tax=Paraconiothyrium brasiliense TaxID=300254 RepID=A0ABR3QU91_9PLEO